MAGGEEQRGLPHGRGQHGGAANVAVVAVQVHSVLIGLIITGGIRLLWVLNCERTLQSKRVLKMLLLLSAAAAAVVVDYDDVASDVVAVCIALAVVLL